MNKNSLRAIYKSLSFHTFYIFLIKSVSHVLLLRSKYVAAHVKNLHLKNNKVKYGN